MDILLLKPSAKRLYKKVKPSLHEHIGLEYIAAKLLAKGVDVGMLDLEVSPMSDMELEASFRRLKPRIVGITVPTACLAAVKKLVCVLRAALCDATVLIGGPHTSAMPEETLEYTQADIAVVGEGEATMEELVAKLLCNENIANVRGICYKTSGKYYVSPRRSPLEKLDALPFPARNLVSRARYGYYVPIPLPRGARKSVFASMLTSRGCPHLCVFCSSKVTFGARYRARSPENVCREIESLTGDLGVNLIYFNDDTFTNDQNRISLLCDEILARKLSFSWLAETRVDCVTPELLEHMAEAGCKILTFGIESGHPDVLKRIKKGINISQISEAFKWAKKAKIRVQANFMLGHPGETREEMQATIDLAKKINPFIAGFYTVLPLPGTLLHKIAVKKHVLDEDFYSKLMFFDKPPVSLCALTPEELAKVQSRAYREFYIRPSQIMSKLLSMHSTVEWESMKSGVQSVLGMLRR